MKLKMIVGMAGTDFSLSPGEETERFGADEAKSLIKAGFAVPVAEKQTEKAVKKPAPEKRTK